jgi:hypothetical protein
MSSLSSRITDLRLDVDKNFKATHDEIDKINVSLGKKVNWSFFFTALLSIVGVLVVVLVAMWGEVKIIGENTGQTKEAVARLEGKLEPFDFVQE